MNKNRSQKWKRDEIKNGYNEARRFRWLMNYTTRNKFAFHTRNPELNYPD